MFQQSSQRYVTAELSVSSLPSLETHDVTDAIDFTDIIWSFKYIDKLIQIQLYQYKKRKSTIVYITIYIKNF